MKKSRVIIGKILISTLVLSLAIGILTLSGNENASAIPSWFVSFIVFGTPVLFYIWLVVLDLEKRSSKRIEIVYHISIMSYISGILYAKFVAYHIGSGVVLIGLPILMFVISFVIFSIFMILGIGKNRKSASLRVIGGLLFGVAFSVVMTMLK